MTTARRPLHALPLRQKAIIRLRGDADLIALGSPAIADRIYEVPPATITWPFLRYGGPDETPVRRGTQVRFTIHSFSKAQYSDECAELNAGIVANLEDGVIDLGGAWKAYVSWIGSQILPDPEEASAWHGVNSFTATIG
jgi:hypothetical protein